MSVNDGEMLEYALLEMAPRSGRTVDILEWGSGKSTVYFPQWMQQCGVDFRWLSLEHNRGYYVDVLRAQLDEVIPHETQFMSDGVPTRTTNGHAPHREAPLQLVVFDYPPLYPASNRQHRGVALDDYVKYPTMLDRRYDVILVDGRNRRRCLLKAVDLLKPGGFVLLHDAHRSHYHCAFDAYPHHGLFSDWLWVGAHDPAPVEELQRRGNQGFSVSYFYRIQHNSR
jgi:hypothetical protein